MSGRSCSVVGCERAYNGKGYCGMHGIRVRRYGSPNPPGLAPRALPTLDRLLSYVEKTDSCWLWNGTTSRTGYGRTSHKGVQCSTHRLFYELLVGPIPEGLEIDHLCMVRNCVNPDHLEPVDHKTNVMRSPNSLPNRARAQTECKHGHPLDRTYQSKRGLRRYCSTCARESSLRRYHASKATA